ncbi:MAG: V-type ATP synthase subunit D [Planctomycetes bacterium]|nr:V-type ATP synthase subunit D [Planctomycetota bacterium]
MRRLLLTKTELKRRRDHLRRYHRYLPVLLLKQRSLQAEVERVRQERRRREEAAARRQAAMAPWIALFGEEAGLPELVELVAVQRERVGVAGVEIQVFAGAEVRVAEYDLMTTPLWVDAATAELRAILALTAEAAVLEEQEKRLGRELRITAQRVNLFERIKIPEATEAIRRIAVALGDQRTAAFGWALAVKRRGS